MEVFLSFDYEDDDKDDDDDDDDDGNLEHENELARKRQRGSVDRSLRHLGGTTLVRSEWAFGFETFR